MADRRTRLRQPPSAQPRDLTHRRRKPLVDHHHIVVPIERQHVGIKRPLRLPGRERELLGQPAGHGDESGTERHRPEKPTPGHVDLKRRGESAMAFRGADARFSLWSPSPVTIPPTPRPLFLPSKPTPPGHASPPRRLARRIPPRRPVGDRGASARPGPQPRVNRRPSAPRPLAARDAPPGSPVLHGSSGSRSAPRLRRAAAGAACADTTGAKNPPSAHSP